MKVYLEPIFQKPDSGEGGIRRIVEAQRRYYPGLGVEIVDDINKADLTAGHGGARPLALGKPFVSHSHGLYWSDYDWEKGELSANRVVIDSLLCADAITVPSRWVRNAYVRGILREPVVIYHGIEPDAWRVVDNPGNYVLWNKPRHDAVSNVNDLMRLVTQTPDLHYVSTLGGEAPNLELIGRLSYSRMKSAIEHAGVYLATARETFGIGTLEALACGVPVAGWDYGGQHEIIVPGETGYLAPYGDYARLADCVRRCFAERARLSVNARLDAETRWTWQDKMERYAQLYESVLHPRTPKVSVIVTCHNLLKYLPDALRSVAQQTFTDWECLVIDDASKGGDAIEVMTTDFGLKFDYLRSNVNLKLSGARNYGFAHARGRYVLNLDADDKLTPTALATLVDALDKNPHLHIAYGGLDILSEDGATHHKNAFPVYFNYFEQMAHLNQLYYAALMRRSVWEQVGGYRERDWRAEDAAFWCRATSYGFRAEKVTDESMIHWRFRADGKSATERRQHADIDGDWTADFPWAIAHTAKEGVEVKKTGRWKLPHLEALPFGAPVKDAPIWHRQKPLVSIIIPLGAGHEQIVIDALDSCIAQTWHDWEAIVVNDTGKPIDKIPGAPYARIVSTKGKTGAGAARNVGLKEARGTLTLFLDADDVLRPDALDKMLTEYGKGKAGYVYSGWRVIRPDGQVIEFAAAPYDRMDWLLGLNRGRNIVTVLMAVEDARNIGFDETMLAYEDWAFFAECAVHGLCGVPIPDKLVTYRHRNGSRSTTAKDHHAELVNYIRSKYEPYAKGAKQMASCSGCPNKKHSEAVESARQAILRETNPSTIGTLDAANVRPVEVVPEGYTRMRFIGERKAPVTYYANGRPYSGGLMAEWRFVDAKNEDVERLLTMGVWEKTKPPAPPAPVTPVQPVQLVEPPPPPQAVPVQPIAEPIEERKLNHVVPAQVAPSEREREPQANLEKVAPIQPKRTRRARKAKVAA